MQHPKANQTSPTCRTTTPQRFRNGAHMFWLGGIYEGFTDPNFKLRQIWSRISLPRWVNYKSRIAILALENLESQPYLGERVWGPCGSPQLRGEAHSVVAPKRASTSHWSWVRQYLAESLSAVLPTPGVSWWSSDLLVCSGWCQVVSGSSLGGLLVVS